MSLDREISPAGRAALQREWGLLPKAFRRRLRSIGPLERAEVLAAQRGATWPRASSITLVAPGGPGWPRSLDDLKDSPELLYLRGRPLPEGPVLAVVGSRTQEGYALRAAREVVCQWARLCPRGAIVSGGGLGVDAAALGAALELGLHPVVALAGGVDRPSPHTLKPLFEAVARSGTLISEALPGASPHPAGFPDRNRLIAALGEATVVVRAARRSGSLHTLRHAHALRRRVLAVVGPIDCPRSAGVHWAIREGLAEPMLFIEDLNSLRPETDGASLRAHAGGTVPAPVPGSEEARVLAALRSGRRSPEALAATLGLTVARTMQIMLALELSGALQGAPRRAAKRTPPSGEECLR